MSRAKRNPIRDKNLLDWLEHKGVLGKMGHHLRPVGRLSEPEIDDILIRILTNERLVEDWPEDTSHLIVMQNVRDGGYHLRDILGLKKEEKVELLIALKTFIGKLLKHLNSQHKRGIFEVVPDTLAIKVKHRGVAHPGLTRDESFALTHTTGERGSYNEGRDIRYMLGQYSNRYLQSIGASPNVVVLLRDIIARYIVIHLTRYLVKRPLATPDEVSSVLTNIPDWLFTEILTPYPGDSAEVLNCKEVRDYLSSLELEATQCTTNRYGISYKFPDIAWYGDPEAVSSWHIVLAGVYMDFRGREYPDVDNRTYNLVKEITRCPYVETGETLGPLAEQDILEHHPVMANMNSLSYGSDTLLRSYTNQQSVTQEILPAANFDKKYIIRVLEGLHPESVPISKGITDRQLGKIIDMRIALSTPGRDGSPQILPTTISPTGIHANRGEAEHPWAELNIRRAEAQFTKLKIMSTLSTALFIHEMIENGQTPGAYKTLYYKGPNGKLRGKDYFGVYQLRLFYNSLYLLSITPKVVTGRVKDQRVLQAARKKINSEALPPDIRERFLASYTKLYNEWDERSLYEKKGR